MATEELDDPRTRFAQPKFSKQSQEPPGSDKQMNPKADHGEDSYRGSRRLEGLNALVIGGDSGIGRAVCIAYARESANAAFTYHNGGKPPRFTLCG